MCVCERESEKLLLVGECVYMHVRVCECSVLCVHVCVCLVLFANIKLRVCERERERDHACLSPYIYLGYVLGFSL